MVFQRSFYSRLLEKRHYYVEKIMRNVFMGFALYIDGRFEFSPPGQRDELMKRYKPLPPYTDSYATPFSAESWEKCSAIPGGA